MCMSPVWATVCPLGLCGSTDLEKGGGAAGAGERPTGVAVAVREVAVKVLGCDGNLVHDLS